MNKRYIATIAVAAALLGGAIWYVERPSQYSTDTNVPAETTATTSRVTITIEDKVYATSVPASISVLDTMRILASSTDLKFTTKEYAGLGALVDSINGKKNSTESYWFLYINGTSSQTGASETFLQSGDTAEWKYKKSE